MGRAKARPLTQTLGITVRLKSKAIVFFCSYLVGAAIIGVISMSFDYGPLPVILWFGVFAVTQFFIIQCPHCRKSATLLPGRIPLHVPWVGSQCRHCGKVY